MKKTTTENTEKLREQIKFLEDQNQAFRNQLQSVHYDAVRYEKRINALLAALVIMNDRRDDAEKKQILQSFKFNGEGWVKLAT